MNIKMLEQQELLQAMNLVWDVYVEHTAPLQSREGVEYFQSLIKIEHVTEQFYRGEVFLWGAYEGAELLGVVMLGKTGRLCLFDVKTNYQAQGVGKALFETMKQFCAQSLGIMRIQVNAAPNAAVIYQSLGFQAMAAEQLENGTRFIPMDYVISAASVQANTKKSRLGLVIGIVAAIFVLGGIAAIFMGRAFYIAMNNMMESVSVQNDYYDSDSYYDSYEDDDYDYDDYDNSFEALEEYIAEDLEYEIEEILYDEFESLEKGLVMFSVAYPQLENLKSEQADKINKVFEEYAMRAANEYYINPSQETKEAMLQGDGYITEDITYRVLYADNQEISVLFERYASIGDVEDVVFEMHGITIDLKTGEVYDAKDLFTYDDAFMEEWFEIMEGEAGGTYYFLEELTLDEMRGILTDEEPIEGYRRVFFMSARGVEVGISYQWGCVTAPYAWDELEGKVTDSPLWQFVE